MSSTTTQVNVRLNADELAVVDQLRRGAGEKSSRAEVIRSLVRARRRAILDEEIGAAYDASGPDADNFGEAGALAAGEALADL